jgi:hypothetical protein
VVSEALQERWTLFKRLVSLNSGSAESDKGRDRVKVVGLEIR